MSEITNDLAIALRKAVPFLARKRVEITVDEPRTTTFAELRLDETVAHTTKLCASGKNGQLTLDEIAFARMLDGFFGGDGAVTVKKPARPTAAQAALASKVSDGIFKGFGFVLEKRLGLVVAPSTVKETTGSAVVVTLSLEGGGKIALALPLNALEVEEPESAKTPDPTIALALTGVEVDVVAELGRVRLALEQVMKMRVGDVVPLKLALEERARVCAGGATLFYGRPTVAKGAVAIGLERRVPIS